MWCNESKLDRIAEEFKGSFDVDMKQYPRGVNEVSLRDDYNVELVKTDMLQARLSGEGSNPFEGSKTLETNSFNGTMNPDTLRQRPLTLTKQRLKTASHPTTHTKK
jgi:hypothetical protein